MPSGGSVQRCIVAGLWCLLPAICVVIALVSSPPRGQSRCRPESPSQVPVLRDSGEWPKQVPKSKPGETATGVPADIGNLSAANRKALFHSIYGGWPPQKRVPSGFGRTEFDADDNDAWHLYNLEKEQDLMKIDDRRWRLDRWLEQVQIRSLVQFTRLGWTIGSMPEHAGLHRRVQEHFRKNHASSPLEKDDRGYTSPQKQATRRIVHLPSKLKNEVTEVLRHFVGEHSGLGYAGIEATATYGIRSYHRGSTLTTHVDKFDTHILSVVYCVDRKEDNSTDKPWYLEVDPDLSGRHVQLDLKAGQLFFYESAKVPHGRTAPLEAEYYAHLFVHFRPVGWHLTDADRRIGLPPFYDVTVGAAVPELCLGRDSWLLARKAAEKELDNLRTDFVHILKLRKNAAVVILLAGLAPGFCVGWGCGWFSASRGPAK